MNYLDDEWWDLQAAEYVLGMLPEHEHQVVSRLLVADADIQKKVSDWEHLLDPLNGSTFDVTPPPGVLKSVLSEIDASESRLDATAQTELDEPKESLLAFAINWASLGAAMAMTAVLIWNRFGPISTPDVLRPSTTVAVLEDESGSAIWTVNLSNPSGESKPGEITISVIGELAIPQSKSYQLWLVLADNSGVDSVGIIPNEPGSSVVFALPAALESGSAFAVSLEDLGGVEGPQHGPLIAINEIVFPIDRK